MNDSRFAIPEDRAPAELNRLREAIDHVDEVLVRLLNQRAKYALEIGRIKGVMQLPIYSPEREKQVLENVEHWSEGPLAAPAIRRLFERIIDESRRVEREASERRDTWSS
jgi:chorismate mutase